MAASAALVPLRASRWRTPDASMPETFLCPIDGLGPGDHACLIYDSDELRSRALEEYLLRGVIAGEKVMLVAAGDADEELGARVRDGAAEGQVDIVLADAAYADGFDADRTLSWFEAAKEAALVAGYTALRAAGGVPTDVYGDIHTVVGYERRANALFADGRMVALCEYDRRAVGEAALLGVLDAHRVAAYAVAGDERVSIETDNGSLRLSGWVDVGNAGVLAPALLDAIRRRADVSLDLAGVVFADVAAVRLFADAARSLAARGRRLKLVSPPPSVPLVLDILGWGDLEGLELA